MSEALLDALLPVARAAGAAIMQIYGSAFDVRDKSDDSPVTDADLAAEKIILAALSRLTPDIPVVAEEQIAAGHRPVVGHEFWLIDPLDGTREFIKRNGEFTVNIGLVRHGAPVLGIVFAPALDRMFAGVCAAPPVHAESASATGPATQSLAFEEQRGVRRRLQCQVMPATGWRVACSRSHGREQDLDDFLRQYPAGARVRIGSSVKFGLIAAGEADIYPRLSPTMEWDTAAGDAVLRAAGGAVTDLSGAAFKYGKAGFHNGSFVAWGHRTGLAAVA